MKRFLALALASFLLWLPAQWSSAAPFVPERDAQCVAFSADGLLAATGKSGLAALTNGPFSPRPHPSPRKAAEIQVWEVASGKMIRRIETFGDLLKLRFSPDGKWIAAARLFTPGENIDLNEVRIWDATTGLSIKHFDRCHDFDFAPNGRDIAVLSRTRCVVFDLTDFSRERELPGLGRSLKVAYTPDGKRLAGIRGEQGLYSVRLASEDKGELLAQSPPLDEPFYSLAISPTGKTLATGHPGGNVLLWDLGTLKPIVRLKTGTPGLQHAFFSPDGNILAAGSQENGTVVMFDTASGKELRRYGYDQGKFRTFYPRTDSDTLRPESDPARFAFSPDGQTILAGPYGGIIRTVEDGGDVKRFSN